jgi:hypothetical protein
MRLFVALALLLLWTLAPAHAAGPGIAISWQFSQDPVNPALGFVIQKCIQITADCPMADVPGATEIPLTTLSYVDPAISFNVPFCYRIAAYNTWGRGNYSPSICGIIGGTPGILPTNAPPSASCRQPREMPHAVGLLPSSRCSSLLPCRPRRGQCGRRLGCGQPSPTQRLPTSALPRPCRPDAVHAPGSARSDLGHDRLHGCEHRARHVQLQRRGPVSPLSTHPLRTLEQHHGQHRCPAARGSRAPQDVLSVNADSQDGTGCDSGRVYGCLRLANGYAALPIM